MINLEPLTLLTHLVLFLIMVYVIINPLLLKPILKVMEEREARIDGNLREAKEAAAAGEELMAEYKHKLEAARKDALQEKDEVKKTAEEEEKKIIVAAREKAGDLMAEIREKISAEYEVARKTLVADTEAMGKDIASRILGRQV